MDYIKQIDWSIEMISSNKLYEVIYDKEDQEVSARPANIIGKAKYGSHKEISRSDSNPPRSIPSIRLFLRQRIFSNNYSPSKT